MSANGHAPARTCGGLRKNGEPCRSTILGEDGFCSMHSPTRSVDPAELGRAGGLRSGEVRRRQAERVRARQEDVRVKVGCEKLVQRRRELRRELAARRAAIVVEMRAKLREELRDLRVEVRRLKRQRARLASAQRANGK